jgi:hypothetical protein
MGKTSYWRLAARNGFNVPTARSLFNEERLPIFVLSHLKDVVKKDDGSYIGYFFHTIDYFEPKILFELEISSKQYKAIVAQTLNSVLGYSIESFALIIRVTTVRGSPIYSTTVGESYSPLVIGNVWILFYRSLGNENIKPVYRCP